MTNGYLIELAAGNAATENKILSWQPHTRVGNKRDAETQREMYRARGFWVRVTPFRGPRDGKPEVFSPHPRPAT